MIAAFLDCRHHLCEPDMKLVWPSAKLLQAAAGASARACEHITSNVLPLLLEQFHKHNQVREQLGGLGYCGPFLGEMGALERLNPGRSGVIRTEIL